MDYAHLDLRSILGQISRRRYRLQYISEYEFRRHIECVLCDCDVPRTPYSIRQHLIGERHRGRENVLDEIQGLDTYTYPINEQKRIVDCIELVDGTLKCSLCDCPLSSGLRNIEQHLNGMNHLNNESSSDEETETSSSVDLEDLLEQISEENEDMRCFYIVECDEEEPELNNMVECKLCGCNIPRTRDNIEQHLSGKRHEEREEVLDAITDLDCESYPIEEQFRIVERLSLDEYGCLECSDCDRPLNPRLRVVEDHLYYYHRF